ncbi:MAG: trimethylamine methyltransferase family protein [Desulfobacterales bacterium]|nr:trimethylamine methyltransferase family protein [Desulfobacterales bacterium]
MNTVIPKITVLNSDQIAVVHDYSLKILSSTGIRVDSVRARKFFEDAIGKPSEDNRVRIPAELVAQALETAPHEISVYNRKKQHAFTLGDDQPRFGIGVTNLYYQDPATDQVEPFTRKHMEISTRLGEALHSYDVVSTIGIARDLPADVADFYGTLEMVANTVKPLVLLVSEEKCFAPVLDLLEHLHGDLAEKPFVVPYFNPITPLVINEGTVDKMIIAIKKGLPIIYSNYGMSGASTPITPTATLALMNAELLAGLVLSQLIKEGAPVILGSLPASFDMKTSGTVYTPTSLLVNIACAEMMDYYRIPHCGTSGSGAGWGPDLTAAGPLWINHLTSCLGKVGLAPFVGGNFDSLAFSPATVVYSDQIIRQSRQFAKEFELNEETIAMDEINSIGPGGDYLTAPLTLKLFRKAMAGNDIWPNLSLEKWQQEARPCRGDDFLRKRTMELIDGLQAPQDHDMLIERGEAFISKGAGAK